ncbi:hypothetical protein [Scytonema sp. PCC 10023]
MKPHRRPLNTRKGVFIFLRRWAIAQGAVPKAIALSTSEIAQLSPLTLY